MSVTDSAWSSYSDYVTFNVFYNNPDNNYIYFDSRYTNIYANEFTYVTSSTFHSSSTWTTLAASLKQSRSFNNAGLTYETPILGNVWW